VQKVLLVEDQLEFQLVVKSILGETHEILIAPTGAAALRIAEEKSPDLVLLDISLPDINGLHLFSKLRGIAATKDVPIVFLTGKNEIADRVAGFSLGADDYIVKPFEPLEFQARIESKLRSRRTHKQSKELIRKGRLLIDSSMMKAFSTDPSGKPTDLGLTPHEFRLLVHFLKHEGHVLSRDQLMSAIWGENIHVLERTIDRHVSTLRRKLDAQHGQIESVHGVGYRFTIA
jgi:DNA-binding response OmpR family regulator